MRTEMAITLALLLSATLTAQDPPPSIATADTNTVDSTIEVLEELKEFLGFEEAGLKRKEELNYDPLYDAVVQGPVADPKKLNDYLAVLNKQDKGRDLELIKKLRGRLKTHIKAVQRTQAEADKILGELPAVEPIDSEEFFQRKVDALTQSILNVERQWERDIENALLWKNEYLQWTDVMRRVNVLKGYEPADVVYEVDGNGGRQPTPRHERFLEILNELEVLKHNFYGVHKSYSWGALLQLREHLDEYILALKVEKDRNADQSEENYIKSYFEQLRDAVRKYQWNQSPSGRAEIGRLLEDLKLAEQSPTFIRHMRGQFWHPNAYVQVSEQLAGAGVNDVINDVSPVTDYMMKTSINGTAYTRGQFRIATAPSENGVSLAVCVDATADSVTTGTRGKVQVHSTGFTTIQASKAMFFADDGTLSSQPSYAKCTTASQITGVSHKRKFVRKIAYKKAMQYKPMGENYASRKGEQAAIEQLDEQVNPLVAKANQAYDEKVRLPLVGSDVFPKWHRLRSSYTDLGGKFLLASDEQIGAPNHPPALPPQKFAATLRIHESAISNVADNLIRSYTLDREKSIDLLKKLEREVPPELQDEQEWSMTFAPRNAIVVRFEDNMVRLGFRGVDFSAEGRSISVEIEFSAKYRVELQPRAVILHRVGDVEGNVIVDQYIPPGKLAVRDVILKKFEAVFEKKFVIESQKLPEPYDKAGDILPGLFTAGYGWATVGINATNVRVD